MSADLYFTGIRFFFFFVFSFFFRQLPEELAERNLTIQGYMVRSRCNLKMHVRNLGYPFPYKSGAQKPPFLTISHFQITLTSHHVAGYGLVPFGELRD